MPDGGDILIRDMQPADADIVHAMIRQIAEATGHGSKLRSSAEDLHKHAFGPGRLVEGIVGERDGEVIGACLYYFTYSTWLGTPGIYVSDIYVDPDARGADTGRRLMAEAARRGKQASASHLRLSVDASNVGAQSFYRQMGMAYQDDEQIWLLGAEGLNQLAGIQA